MSIKYYKFLDLIQRKGITKMQFASMTGFSSATVAKLTSHKPVTIQVIDRTCKVLECQPFDIMEYVDDEDINSK